MNKRIGIDCRLSGPDHAGIGRYIDELVKRLIETTDITWVLFVGSDAQLPFAKGKENVEIVNAPVRHYTLAEQFVMPRLFAKAHIDLLHVPHFNVPLFYNGPFLVTIHDLLWHEQRGSHVTTLSPLVYSAKYRSYRWVVSHAVSSAEAILVPAATIQQTIMSNYPLVDPSKITVTSEGVDRSWFTKGTDSTQPEKLLFYTGSLYPHKNVRVVVEALKQLPEYHLAVSSSRDVFVDEFLTQVSELGMSDRVTHLGRLSDDELKTWYAKSMALVQPSLSEGFGLTGVEAMAAGVPVIASNIAIFNEVYGDACIAFDPHSPESFVRAIQKLENSDRTQLIKTGIERAKTFSWESMAKKTLSVYQSLL